jgi:two-component system CheB/CheR fusion protein
MARKRSSFRNAPTKATKFAKRRREPEGREPEHTESPTSLKKSFPIVGIGASAGGLEAFTAFLKHLPSNPGMAFVLIQHLDPNQPSQLTDLLSKATSMPVAEVKADTSVAVNHVYVMPPGVCLSITDEHLRIEPRGPGRNLPIDFFLRSLATVKSSNAVGIVLSGTASDGTLGLKAVKAEGGVTFVQDPSSAKFDGMPRSAMAAGVVDFVLTPAEIAKRLVQLARHPYVARKPARHDDAEDVEFDLNRIFHLLRMFSGNDFTHYKPSTIRRRIHRRMVLHGDEKLSDYVTHLQENPAEVRALADDLLICVTSFFREPEAFEALARTVFPSLLKNRSLENPVRIWVPGCATGEETYSIAICLAEVLEASGTNIPIQIFATDVSEAALDKARAGRYGPSVVAEISPDRLRRFFKKADADYQIDKSLREICIFAKQNIAKDPPFRNLDLISCCNVLIYFGSVLQRKALSVFHYALKPNGFLRLGPSESVGALPHGFVSVDATVKLYSKKFDAPPIDVQFGGSESLTGKEPAELTPENVRLTLDVQRTAERMLLAQYVPAGVIIDDALNVVHVRGSTGPYLQLATGEPTYNLLRMAREGLIVGLRTSVLKAKQKKTPVTAQVRVKQNGDFKDVILRVIPLSSVGREVTHHFIVLFEDVKTTAAAGGAKGVRRGKKTENLEAGAIGARSRHENAQLEQELAATKEYLQSIIEEQEATTEELKSANEEAQASNEELETSKEELQSTNEELNTLNDELKNRNTALAELNNDLSNLLTSINVPLVMVGRDLKIRRFTQVMAQMLNLIDSDVGRSIADFKPNIDLPDLAELLRTVIRGGAPLSREIQGSDGHWYSLNALPYRTPGDTVDGAMIVLLDVHAIKLARNYAEAVVETVRQPLLILSKELKIIRANPAFYEVFGTSSDAIKDRSLYEVDDGQWNIPELRMALEKILPQQRELENLEVDHEFRKVGRKTLVFSGREIFQPPPYGETILLAIDDITSRTNAQRNELAIRDRRITSERALRDTQAELARMSRAFALGEIATSIAHEVNQPLGGIVTNAEAALRWLGGEPPNIGEAKDSLALIARDGNRAGEVIRRMRDFLKKGHGETAALNINESIQNAVALVLPEMATQRITVYCDLSSEIPIVRGDSIQLQQVILNLLMNGAEAMTSTNGAKELTVTSRKSPDGGALVAVRDCGIGGKPEDMHRMFDAFYTSKPTGIGMGLSISRSIIEAHGGQILAEVNDGPGLTVTFSLPADGAGQKPSKGLKSR